jgi:ribosomal protein L11 methyltransferase
LAERRLWSSLTIEAPDTAPPDETADRLSLILDDWPVAAIEDLAELPLPPGGLWDPTYPPIPEPPPSPVRWRVFFETPADRDAARAAIARAFPDIRLEAADVADEDWAARSQRALTAVHAGRFIVAPPWDRPVDAGDADVIVIEPSMGFGTGHHATTRLCLRALSAIDATGRTAIDVGTGSGVLALAAALRGARSVLALDVDADAIGAARESAALNPIASRVTFETGDFRTRSGPAADLVCANLTGGMLTMAAAHVRGLVSPGGTLIVSGFDVTEERAVRDALGPADRERRFEEDRWVAFALIGLNAGRAAI